MLLIIKNSLTNSSRDGKLSEEKEKIDNAIFDSSAVKVENIQDK